MTRLPRVTSQDAYRALIRAGFIEIATRGGHRQLRRPDGSGRVTIPYHSGRLIPPGTLRSILEQAGMTAEEFIALL